MKLIEENSAQDYTMDGLKPNRSPSVRQILTNLDNDPEIKAKTSRYKSKDKQPFKRDQERDYDDFTSAAKTEI